MELDLLADLDERCRSGRGGLQDGDRVIGWERCRRLDLADSGATGANRCLPSVCRIKKQTP